MGSSSGSSTTVVKNIPDYADAYAHDYLQNAYALSNAAYSFYSGTLYAAFTADESSAYTAMANRGANPDPAVTDGVALLKAMFDGDYLAGTHAPFTTMIALIAAKVAEEWDANIYANIGGKALLMGDPDATQPAQTLSAGDKAKQLARVNAEVYMKNWQSEKGHQAVSLGDGPTYANQGYIDAEARRTAGLWYREWLQGSYESAYKKWIEDQHHSVQRLDILGNAVRAMVGTQTETTTPYYKPNPAISTLGGAMSGAAAGATVGGPIGAAVGGLIGAGLGYASSQ